MRDFELFLTNTLVQIYHSLFHLSKFSPKKINLPLDSKFNTAFLMIIFSRMICSKKKNQKNKDEVNMTYFFFFFIS